MLRLYMYGMNLQPAVIFYNLYRTAIAQLA
jgi:hypothetical protein